MFHNTDSDLVRNNMILLWRGPACLDAGWRWAEAAAVLRQSGQCWASGRGLQLGHTRSRSPAAQQTTAGPQHHNSKAATTSQQQGGHNSTTSQQHHSSTQHLASLRRAAVIRLTHAAARRPEIRVLLFCGSGDCD